MLASGVIPLYSVWVNDTTCCTAAELVNVSVLLPNTLPVTEPDTFNEPEIVSLPIKVFEPVVANELVFIEGTFNVVNGPTNFTGSVNSVNGYTGS